MSTSAHARRDIDREDLPDGFRPDPPEDGPAEVETLQAFARRHEQCVDSEPVTEAPRPFRDVVQHALRSTAPPPTQEQPGPTEAGCRDAAAPVDDVEAPGACADTMPPPLGPAADEDSDAEGRSGTTVEPVARTVSGRGAGAAGALGAAGLHAPEPAADVAATGPLMGGPIPRTIEPPSNANPARRGRSRALLHETPGAHAPDAGEVRRGDRVPAPSSAPAVLPTTGRRLAGRPRPRPGPPDGSRAAGPRHALSRSTTPTAPGPDLHQVEVTGPTQMIGPLAPTLLPGTRFMGMFEGSGYREPPHLVSRADGQLVRLPPLLWEVLALLDHDTPLPGVGHFDGSPGRTLTMVASALRERTGDGYQAEHIAYLVDNKLAPLGLTYYTNGAAPSVEKSHAFLGLRYKADVLSARVSWVLAGLTMWLFHPIVMAGILTVFVFVEIWALTAQEIGTALQEVFLDPGGVLLVVLISVLSAAFHEVGHAAGCRWAGARPGAMGCGIYLVWPAFFTDITDSYRLGRGGRVLADLGGVYFNALWVVGLAGLYIQTDNPLFLVAILSVNMEILQQLLPSLRFDGYHIMADLVGIPDLFKYIGPILKRVILRRPPDPRLLELKRWPQVFVSFWVLCVIPALAFQLGLITWHIPGLARTGYEEARRLLGTLGASGNYALDLATAIVQILFLALPIAGVCLILWQLSRTLLRVAVTAYRKKSSSPRSDATRDRGRHRHTRRWIDEAHRDPEQVVCDNCAKSGGEASEFLLRVESAGTSGARLMVICAGCRRDGER